MFNQYLSLLSSFLQLWYYISVWSTNQREICKSHSNLDYRVSNFDIKFVLAAKYLGIRIGIIIDSSRWQAAFDGYKATVRVLKGFSLGLAKTMRL